MARLTKEEIEEFRAHKNYCHYQNLVDRALDELEEHRAREGKVERDGVLLSEEAVEKIRKALENERVGAMPNSYARRLVDEALALLPPKKEPTLLEAAKAVLRDNGLNPENAAALRSAIEREEGRPQ